MEIEARLLPDYFKTLGDETRLRLLGLLAEQERPVQELSTLLGLSAPTVSHHINRLRRLGLLRLRQQGNQRFYRLDTETLDAFKRAVQHLESLAPEMPEDYAWIEPLLMSAWEKKVLRDNTSGGRLKQIPAKEKKFLVILTWLATQFQEGRIYNEAEVNAVLGRYHEDYATLRRGLINYGFLRRERGGSQYWVTPAVEAEEVLRVALSRKPDA